MTSVEVTRTTKLGLQVVKYRVMDNDPRGPFMILLELEAMEAAGLELRGPLRQLNMSKTKEEGTTRGVHVSNTGKYCAAPLAGDFFWNPVVDLTHPDSPTFGQWEAIDLVPGTAVYVPPGYGNCVQAQNPGAVYVYLLDGDFDPAAERVVNLDDPDIGLGWPTRVTVVSAKDRAGLSLEAYAAQL
jgi:dTDP-4-dehydrorhamnose 3,5-epimerase